MMEEDYIETVLTCEGDFYDPEFHSQLEHFSKQLKTLISEDTSRQLVLKKVEPWNSVKVTFSIPKEAAVRLKQLAEQGDQTLRSLGILSVQIDGDQSISLTLAGKNNETTELIFRTASTPPSAAAPSSSAASNPSLFNPPSEKQHVEATQNIARFLGSQGQASAALLDIFGSNTMPNENSGLSPGNNGGPFASPQQPPFSSPSRSPSYQANRLPPSYSSSQFVAPSFPSPGNQHSPASPKYPTPPPSVSNPNSPGLRTGITFPGQQSHQQQHPQGQFNPMVNNMVRLMSNKDITSSSPLLVNLLQNDANAMGHLNNFAQHARAPFAFDSGAPPKKKKVPTATLR